MSELAVIPNKMTRHAYVKVRHSGDCPDRTKEEPLIDSKTGAVKKDATGKTRYPDFGDYRKCRCRKWVFKYDSSVSTKTERESAKTRDWVEAEAKKQEWLDQFDPDKVRIKQFEEADKHRKEAEAQKTVTIEEAIGRFLNNKQFVEKREPGTLESLQTILGYVDPKTFAVRRPGKLLIWVNNQSPRPVFVSDLTPILVENFLSSWKVSDTTASHDFGKLKQFFKYCLKHRWISDNPMAHSKRQEIKKGNRTGAFSDEQWITIRNSARAAVEQATDLEGRHEAQRLLTFVELLRWSGMALVDATLFSFDDAPKCHVDANGVLTYQRTKTDKTAITTLPAHVLALLRDIPEARGSTKHQPFLEKGKTGQPKTLDSVKHSWWLRLIELYKAAGIGKIKTDIGAYRNPGAHTFRDTFAIGVICSGINDSIQVAAKCLGDTILMVENHYMPWIEKMKSQQAGRSNQAIAAQLKQLEALENKELAEVIPMGGRRG